VFELNEMQAAEESLDGGYRPGPVIEQEGSTAAVEGHAIDVHGHLAGKAAANLHVCLGVSGMPYPQHVGIITPGSACTVAHGVQ